MTLCPYKWFLYIASVWALVYVMIETWIQLRGNNKASITSTTSHPNYAHEPNSDSDEEDDDEVDEEQDEYEDDHLHLSAENPHLRQRSTAHTALPQTAPIKLFS